MSSVADGAAAGASIPRPSARERQQMPSSTPERTEEDVRGRLAEVVAGDRAAREWLYDEFAPRLFRRLRARYGGRGGLDPEELLHDAYISFFQNESRVLGRFLERQASEGCSSARLEAYLWGLACGIASNRRRSIRRHGEPESLEDRQLREERAGESAHVDRDTLQRLGGCLKKAGSRVYLYYKLRFVEGRSPEEIAGATGWSRKATYKLKLALNGAVERCARLLRIG